MKILQVSNLVSHHQLPLARCLANIVGEHNFRFAAVDPPDPKRLSLGWSAVDDASWILRAGENDFDRNQLHLWWEEADVVLTGELFLKPISERLDQNRLTLYMSERWWKPPVGVARLLSPRFAYKAYEFKQLAQRHAFHYLPIGPFASDDIATLARLEDRKWRWGYFTEEVMFSRQFEPRNEPLKVLWAGRMLSWKRVDVLMHAVAANAKRGSSCQLTLVGDGPVRHELERLAGTLFDRTKCVFHDPVPADQIPQLMNEHDVYVLPSSGYEGWGAVVNEAMGSGAAVVACQDVGAAAAMLKNDVNGLLFKSGDWRELARLLKRLEDERVRWRLGKAARDTIEEAWSPRCAAERFVEVADALLKNRCPPVYQYGPMAKAR